MNTDIPGDLIVSEEVLADIAGHAALQCYGVVGMAQPAAANGLAKFLPQSPLRKGVIVSVDEDGVLISLYVVLEHGVNINVVSTISSIRLPSHLKNSFKPRSRESMCTYRESKFVRAIRSKLNRSHEESFE